MSAPAVYREGCGTHLGLLLHQANGEEPCAECRYHEWARLVLYGTEAGRRLLAEAIPQRPSPVPAEPLKPVTPEQARRNRKILEAEVIAYERAHGDGRTAEGRAAA